jgi:hypothetical protein
LKQLFENTKLEATFNIQHHHHSIIHHHHHHTTPPHRITATTAHSATYYCITQPGFFAEGLRLQGKEELLRA